MNKKQFEDVYLVKQINSYLKKNNVETRLRAEKNFNGDYNLVWECVAGNLPEKLKELTLAKKLKSDFLTLTKEA